jgi:hypothetical protein
MARACSTNGRGEECIQDVGGKARRRKTTRKTKSYGWTILKWILERLDGIV